MSCLQNWRLLQKEAFKITGSNIKKLYFKNGLLAVIKPYGLPMHGGLKVKKSFINLLPELEQNYSLPAGSLELANRLDKNVSGVVLLTYTTEMASYIGQLHRKREIEKTYLAVLLGNLSSNLSGELRSDIVENQKKNSYQQLAQVNKNKMASEAVTQYQILDNSMNTCMLCEFKTKTGYKHQIRVHASQLLNSPILGDHKYHPGEQGPQLLPLRMMQLLRIPSVKSQTSIKGKFRPWQRALVPMHLFAQKVVIPGLDNDGDTAIEAAIPLYFRTTMENCNLMTDRLEFEGKKIATRKVWREFKESPFASKGVAPENIGQETSL